MLTVAEIKAYRPKDKPYKILDGKGLYLHVSVAGGKAWHYRYELPVGNGKTFVIGAYPDVSLETARNERARLRQLVKEGIDPVAARRDDRQARIEAAKAVEAAAASIFEAVAMEWIEQWSPGKAASHVRNVRARLENYVFPAMGKRPVSEITAPEVLRALQRIQAQGFIENAHRVKVIISQVMRYAIATGRAERDPCPDLKGSLQPTPQTKHMPAFTDPADVARLLQEIDAYRNRPKVSVVTWAALALTPLLFVRPGELQAARWQDIDLERAEWKYTVSKTKTEHLVPLAAQAVAILRELKELTGGGEWLFPGRSASRHISNGAINRALQTMGFDTKNEITGHGFRAIARTLLAERLEFDPLVIEHQLAHKVPDTLGNAYNRTKYISQRRAMMQAWADYLDGLREG